MPPALRMPRWAATICQLSCDMATATTWSGPVRKARNRRRHGLRSRVELGEGQRLAGVGNLQGREIRKPLGGAAEDLREPPDTLLMRHVHEVRSPKTSVRLYGQVSSGSRGPSCRRPEVPPPRHERQHEEGRERGQDKDCRQGFASNAYGVSIPAWRRSSDPGRRARLPVEQDESRMLNRSIAAAFRSADVQGHAMESAAQHLGVPQLERDDVEPVLLQKPDEGGLISIDHHQIRIDAERIHVDPVAADASGQIIGIVPVRVLHRRAVDDFPLLQDRGQRIVVRHAPDCRASGRGAAPRASSRCGCRSRRP